MNIAVNAQLLIWGKLDGIGWFTYETMQRIIKNNPGHRFYLIFDRKPHPSLKLGDNARFIVLRPSSRHPFLWFLRFEILLPFLLKKIKADVFLSPDGWMTLGTSIPCVHILHDLNFAHKPGDLPFWTRLYYNTLFPRYARKATRVGTVSQYSKEDIVKTYHVPPEKIDVMHNGCNVRYKPLTEEVIQSTRKKFSAGYPFFLYVGALIPRKNIARMFRAFDLFKKNDTKNVKLLIVGQKKWWTPEIDEAYANMKYQNEVVFLGRRDVDELNMLYAASLSLLFVPVFEGFGIPVLEAFHSGTAVITSRTTSLPEVAGDAALFVDPYSEKEIADAMKKIASDDESVRNMLIEKGEKRKLLFSWDKTAAHLWKTIEKATHPE
ncbi:MAG: glycosyltransferase family 4 protein [Bacteroidota bacterium]